MLIRVLIAFVMLYSTPEKEKRPTAITTVIRSANRQLKAVISDDYSAKTAIDETGVLKGAFSAVVRTYKVRKNEDGSIDIEGYVSIKHPDQARYRTRKNADRIIYLNGLLAQAEAALRKSRNPGNGETRDPYTISRCQAEVARRRNDRDDELKKIRAAETRLRHLCERLRTDLKIPSKAAKNVEVETIMKRKRIKLTAKIAKWSVGREPEEVGESVVVASIDLAPIEIDPRYTSNPPSKP